MCMTKLMYMFYKQYLASNSYIFTTSPQTAEYRSNNIAVHNLVIFIWNLEKKKNQKHLPVCGLLVSADTCIVCCLMC